VEHGITIIAVGGAEYRPTEYGFGSSPQIITQLDFQEALARGTAGDVQRVVMIQCVGSREVAHPYCSRLCCSQAVSNALKLKGLNPRAEVIILYRDIRTYGTQEVFYKQAREAGVRFLRFDPEDPPLVSLKGDQLTVTVLDQSIQERVAFTTDQVVLSTAVRPNPETRDLATRLKLPLDRDGFFMEAHLKLRPLDFTSAGFFLCGLAHGPKPIEENVVQAKGAAARAATILGRKSLLVGGEVALVDRSKCAACLSCLRACPFGVPQLVNGAARIDPAACRGCGVCAGVCPGKAIQVAHHQDQQILAKAEALFDEPGPESDDSYIPRIIAFICTYCTYTAADMAGSMRLQYPPNVRVVKLLCTGRIDVQHILKTFEAGADAVMVSGCELGDCHFQQGNYRAVKRVAQTKQILADCGLEPERIEMFHVGASDAPGWAAAVNQMVGRAKRLGPNPLRSNDKMKAA
jgi:coenzyme F420-reducing hydrogenase delta subunit/Pyruvate/2-oxoacid:ferredoxin oxidoreductase delta subunit